MASAGSLVDLAARQVHDAGTTVCTITIVRAYVGVTDDSWYRFLAARPEVTEVNFRQPSGGREFRVLAPGEPFFFKTHYPHHKVVGGGFSAIRGGG